MHYFSPQPDVASAPRELTVTLPDGQWTFTTDTGVFSHGKLDAGTRVLLEKAPAPSSAGNILDLGCGWGPIAVVLGSRMPEHHLWAVDVNERALELTRENVRRAGLSNVTVCAPDELPSGLRFASIYSNPPTSVGKPALHALLQRHLGLLTEDGAAYLVISKHLGSDSLARWLEGQGYPTRRLASRRGYRVLEVRFASQTGSDC